VVIAAYQTAGANRTLAEVVQYYGTSLGYYVAWLSFYSDWLLAPALFGVLLWANNLGGDTGTDADAGGVPGTNFVNQYMVIYAIGISIWSTLFLQCWTRRQADLSMQWGMSEGGDDTHIDDEVSALVTFIDVLVCGAP
jgi:hypothetical protein